MTAGNNVLSDSQEESWTDLPQSDQAKTATRLINTVEGSAFQVAKTMKKPETLTKVGINIGQ